MNILTGSQEPCECMSLAYIDGKLKPNYSMPTIQEINMLTVTHRKGFKYPMVIDNHGLHVWGIGNRVYIYAIGYSSPRYPVPAIREKIEGGGIAGRCIYIGATFIDWSRGYLEFY